MLVLLAFGSCEFNSGSRARGTYGTNSSMSALALVLLAAVAGAVLIEGVDSGAMLATGRVALALAEARRGAARSGSRG